ncbi:hypothetical protein jhhlp_002302, partial [Lomentospora prolificans]
LSHTTSLEPLAEQPGVLHISSLTTTMITSYGRGGAGNMSNAPHSPLSYKDLQTPTLKTTVFTTGRGGSGNMASNNDPKEARLRQDVEPVVRRSSSSAQYAGRGGAGNIFRTDELARSKSAECAIDDSSSGKSVKSLDLSFANKGVQWLRSKK